MKRELAPLLVEFNRVNRLILFSVVILIVFFSYWLFFSKISGAVISRGVIKTDINRLIIQHPEGGVIEKIFIRDGAKVSKDALILKLENHVLESNLRNLTRQLSSERLRRKRLEFEIEYPKSFNISKEDYDLDDYTTQIDFELSLYNSRRKNLESQLDSINQQIASVQSEINSLEKTVQNDKVILSKNYDLKNKGFVSDIAVINVEQTLNLHLSELSKASQRLIDLKQRLPIVVNDFKNNAATELRVTNDKISELEEKIRPLENSVDKLNVKSSISGTVVNLTKLSEGSVLGAKEIIAEVVPENSSLIIETQIPPDQVVFIKKGLRWIF